MTIPAEYYRVIRRNPYLVCYWRLNDTSGNFAIDYAGRYGINGIYNSSPLVGIPLISAVGNEVEVFAPRSRVFGSNNQNVEIPNAEQLGITGNMTIEVWIISLSLSQTSIIIGKPYHEYISCPYYLGLELGKVIFSRGSSSVTKPREINIKSSSSVTVGIPTHIVATNFNGVMTLIINGVKVKSENPGSVLIENTEEPLYIGGTIEPLYVGGVNYFNGMISEVALYNNAISERMAKEHYNIGKQTIFRKPYYLTYDPPSYS